MTPHKEDYLKVIMELGGDNSLSIINKLGRPYPFLPLLLTYRNVSQITQGWPDQPHPYQGVQITEKDN